MRQNRNMAILFFTMIVVMIGFGLIIPILPFYVEQLGANGKDLGMLMAIFSIMQLIFAPIWGSLSERYGRKSILLVGIFGNAISQLMFGLSSTLWMMYASRALAGILSSATMPTAMAYIGDSTDEKNRSGGMGMIGAAMGVGMVLGPGLGGWLSSRPIQVLGLNFPASLSTPFFFAAALSLVAMALVIAILPESLPKSQRDMQVTISGPQIGKMWQALKGPLGFLLFLAFLVSFGLTSFEGIFGLYANHRYNYDPTQVGTVLTVVGLISALIQGFLTGPATRYWGNLNVIKASLIGSAVGFVVMLMANSFPAVLITVGLFVISNAMLRPAISSVISTRADTSQGIAMGLNNSFMSLGRIIGPLWAGALLDINYDYPYMSAAVVMLIGFVLSMYWLSSKRTKSAAPVETVEREISAATD